jgi:hypothetical protein
MPIRPRCEAVLRKTSSLLQAVTEGPEAQLPSIATQAALRP